MKQIMNFVALATVSFIIFEAVGTLGIPNSDEIRLKNLERAEIQRVFNQGGEVLSECGGEANIIAGVISYRFLTPLIPAENCLWIIKAANKISVNFRMIYSGFEGTNASLFIYSPVTASGEIRQLGIITRSMQTAVQYTGGVFFIHLSNPPSSSRENEGTGFLFSFDGAGSDNFAVPQYTHRIYYAVDEWYLHQDEDDEEQSRSIGVYRPNEFLTFSLPNESGKKISLTVNFVTIPTDNRLNSICSGDILNVYEVNYQQLYSRIRFCGQDTSRIKIESTEKLFITFNAVNRTLAGRVGFLLEWIYIDIGSEIIPPEVSLKKRQKELGKIARE